MLLAWLAGILAGYALAQDVEPYDEPPEDSVALHAAPSDTPG